MAKLSDEKISLIQTLYAKYHTYAAVAREVQCSPATVKKYCTKDNSNEKPAVEPQLKFTGDIPEWGTFNINFDDKYLTQLTDEEKEEIRDMWKEWLV